MECVESSDTAAEEECIVQQLIGAPFIHRLSEERLAILKQGRPQPDLPGLVTRHLQRGRKSFMRHFHASEYDKVPWLTGSKVTNTLFCWPCLLFRQGKTPWTKEGISNLNALSTSVKKHARSQFHLLSEMQMASYAIEMDEQLKLDASRHNKLVTHNREILKRLIDCVCHLAKLEAPFHGHDESSTSLNKGHYLELLTLIGRYDHLLKTHLETATVFCGTSNQLLNRLIEAVEQVMLDQIKEEVKGAPFVAILLDETSDVMKESRLSTVLRYVAQDGSVNERFVGFADMSADKSAAGLLGHVLEIAKEFQLSDKLVAQTYDGGAVLGNHFKGLCTKVQERFPNALFVHCFAHRLNLVLQQVCMNIKECRIFFLTLSGLDKYFSESPKLSEELKLFMIKRLPGVRDPSGWIFTLRLVQTVSEFQPQLIEFFDHLLDDTAADLDGDALVKAQGFRSFLKNFHNTFLLAAFSRIFQHTDVLQEILQDIGYYDISKCYPKVMETRAHLEDERERFVTLWEEVITKSQAYEIEEPSPKKLMKIEENDGGTVTPQETFSRIYCEVIDTITAHLEDRFFSTKQLHFISLMDPQLFGDFKINFPTDVLGLIHNTYSTLFDWGRLRNELTAMYSWRKFREEKSVHSLLKNMHHCRLKEILPQVYRLGSLILTILTTAATVEPFSARERIKSFIKASMGQEIMSSMSFLAIEKEVLCNLKQTPEFYSKVIEEIAEQSQLPELNFQ